MTNLLVCLFYELRAVRAVAEDDFNHPDIANELYLWGVFQHYRFMLEFKKENFTGNPKFHPQIFISILETMVTRVDMEGVSTACANVIALPLIVINIASSVDTFGSLLRALETTVGLEVGGGGGFKKCKEKSKQEERCKWY